MRLRNSPIRLSSSDSSTRSFACSSAFAVFFFFQAEDGIRDLYVTGVQTCALPIFDGISLAPHLELSHATVRRGTTYDAWIGEHVRRRSEERRVGKECRSRWSP